MSSSTHHRVPPQVIKQLILATLAYTTGFIAMYGVDILTILANGLVLVKSFAASFGMSVNIVLPQITLDISLNLPQALRWFPHTFEKALAWLDQIFAHINLPNIALSRLQVTCVGSQAPGEVSV